MQFIHGLQNGSAGSPASPHYQIIATAKHYLGYDMTGGDTNISDRWAAEYYLPQFEKAIKVGGVREIMTAHVAVNGVRMAANHFYNQHIVLSRVYLLHPITAVPGRRRFQHTRHEC